MKRSRPPNLDDAARVPRRRRSLSEEEWALWDAVAKSTRPLKKRPRPAKAQIAVPEPPAASPGPTAPANPPMVAPPLRRTKLEPPPLAVLGRRERSQLARGKKDIDGRLDLHGMTQSRAHRALLGFLQRASDDGLAFVLVITGKGRTTGPDSERGILRRQVPEWLGLPEFRACVIGFEEAHIGHGGEGALYVRIRRRR